MITSDSDGNVWFAAENLSLVAQVSTSGEMTEFTVSEPPLALAPGENGEMWYVGEFEVGRLYPDGSVTTFASPLPGFGSSRDIVFGPDGNLWIVGKCSNNVYRVTPNGDVRTFPVADGGCPQSLAVGADDNIWVTLHSGDAILRVALNGAMTRFATPPVSPADIVSAPDGHLYFTNNDGHLGKITTAGVVTMFAIIAAHFGTLTAGSDGNLWLASPSQDFASIVRVTPTGGKTEFALPSGANAVGITSGADGRVWFADRERRLIGAVTTSGVITSYPAAILRGDPQSMSLGADGNIWFTETGANKIGKISPTGDVMEWDLPEPASSPGDITLGPDGAMWFTQIESGKIGRATAAGVTEFSIPSPYGKPTGITRGIDNNLWFTLAADDQVARITPAGVVTEIPVPGMNLNLENIVGAPDGTLWMTTATGIARMAMDGTGFQTFSPDWLYQQQPRSLVVAPDGTIWFTGGSGVGRIYPQSGNVHRVAQLQAGEITVGPDGAIWTTALAGGELLRFTLEQELHRISIPSNARWLSGIAAGSDGNIWFGQPQSGSIARMNVDLPITAMPATICPDGLAVDGIVATFTDSDPAGTASEFTADVHWSDGAVGQGVIASAGDHFLVSASHTFEGDGPFSVRVQIRGLASARDVGGSSATATSVIRTAQIVAPWAVCVSSAVTATVLVDGNASGYEWTISNGAIVSGQGTSAIRFVANGTSDVQLGVSAITDGCVVSTSTTIQAKSCFRGDANGDRVVSTADAFFLIHYFFADGPAPVANGDANSNGTFDLGDLTFLTKYLLADGPAPLP